jgi:hypothetical protein
LTTLAFLYGLCSGSALADQPNVTPLGGGHFYRGPRTVGEWYK